MNNSPRGRGSDKVQSSPDLAYLTVPQLRAYRADLREEEERVAYWRRLVQSRQTALTAGHSVEPLSVDELHRALGSTGTGERRDAILSVHTNSPLSLLPSLTAAWAEGADEHDLDRVRVVRTELAMIHERLTNYRDAICDRLATATSELITRYIEDPEAAFDLIGDVDRRPSS